MPGMSDLDVLDIAAREADPNLGYREPHPAPAPTIDPKPIAEAVAQAISELAPRSPSEMPITMVDIPGLAEMLATTERHVRDLIYKQEIPYYKVGKLVRFDVAEVREWLADRRVETAPR